MDTTTALAEIIRETTSASWETACTTAEQIRDGLSSRQLGLIGCYISSGSVKTLDDLNYLLNV